MIINDKKYRFTFLLVFLFLIVVLFVFRLAQLQIVQGNHYSELAQNKMVQKITETAPRGSIYTKDGYEIAKNKIGYSVELTYSKSENAEQNIVLLKLYDILEKNGEKFKDDFPIIIENNKLIYTYEKEEMKWKQEQGIPVNATAAESLKILRNNYNVKKEVSNEIALEAIGKIHMNSGLPLLIKEGEILFSYENTELQWKKDNGFQKEEYGLSAKESFQKLKKKYEIANNIDDRQARKILVFRQLFTAQGFRSWEPIELASSIKLDTVFEIDASLHELPGVTVSAKPVRDYPFKTLASHVLGYIGKVSEKDVEDDKYKMNDLKGISGIEYAYQDDLKGKDGQKFAVTDYKGRPQNDPTKKVIDPVSGNNVVLTIDYDLQKVAEEALAKQIKAIQKSKAPKAKSGAVVVIDVNTGGILALASYPDYDLNLFTNGISKEDWDKLNVLVEDSLFPKPLFNNATMAALQPGSVFKPMMAAAGLQEKVITKSSIIYCPRTYPRFKQFTCLGYHSSETIREAIKDSCNIFFYETGFRLSVDNIEKYAKEFGLGSKTGIEISESSGYLATKEDKKKIWTYATSDYIRNIVGIEGTSVIINDEGKEQEVYKSYAIAKELNTKITSEKFPDYGAIFKEVVNIMSKYNVKDNSYLHGITVLVNSGRWSPSDTINAAIGQGGNSFTPIQIANYLATLVNGGVHRETYLVDQVVTKDGQIKYQHKENVVNKVDVDEEYITEIKKGMKDVAMFSSGRNAFVGFDHSGIGIGGKTGTAQYGSENVANTAWFMGFAPFEKPEIAVVSMIIQGDKSGNSVPIAREIMDAYFYKNTTAKEAEEAKKEDKVKEEQINSQEKGKEPVIEE